MSIINFRELLSANLGKMLVIQNKFGNKIANFQKWNVDLTNQEIYFGEEVFKINFIGSESTVNNTWLWGYKNINGFSEEMLNVVNNIKKYAEENDIDEINQPECKISNELNGYIFSIVACGFMGNIPYYRCTYDKGAIFVAITNASNKIFDPINEIEFSKIVLDSISKYNLNHKIFVEEFLKWNTNTFIWENDKLIANFEKKVTIEFERVNGDFRIIKINIA